MSNKRYPLPADAFFNADDKRRCFTDKYGNDFSAFEIACDLSLEQLIALLHSMIDCHIEYEVENGDEDIVVNLKRFQSSLRDHVFFTFPHIKNIVDAYYKKIDDVQINRIMAL